MLSSEAIALSSSQAIDLRDNGVVWVPAPAHTVPMRSEVRDALVPRVRAHRGMIWPVLEPWVPAGDTVLFGADQDIVMDRALRRSEDMDPRRARHFVSLQTFHFKSRSRAAALMGRAATEAGSYAKLTKKDIP